MVAYKAAQCASFIRSPDKRITSALIYGPEAALVAERARELARNIAALEQPEAEIIRLDDNDLTANPDRLAIELQTRSMFAARRIVRIKAERRLRPEALEELIAGDLAATLIVEAGNLRPSSKLRKIFETNARAAALPCYAGAGGSDVAPLIERELSATGARITREARAYLMSRLAGEQAVARSECAKLATYAGAGGEVSIEDIDAVIGELGSGMADALARATAEGRTRDALRHLDNLIASGQGTQTALAALSRHYQRLHRLCALIESGDPAKTAISKFKPPLHFKLRDALLAHCRDWSRNTASRALRQIQDATRLTRLTPAL
ncbi:MAG: DNA polymerase III subunit delta, partial [Methyloligellaceae bacterium]